MTYRRTGSRRKAVRRGVAIGVTTALHVLMFVVITRPVTDEEVENRASPKNGQSLHLRLIRSLTLSSPKVLTPADIPVTTAQPQRTTPLVALPKSKASVMRPSQIRAPAPTPAAPGIQNPVAAGAVTSTLPPSSSLTDSDGGFANRLRQAVHSYSVAPLPGSDAPLVRGIELIDPKTRGIAAATRQAQRLFGVVNHHCVDVDAWHRMSPGELNARHISPSDIARVDAENHCNSPMGLSL